MADNGKLQFFGQTVYPQTLSTNILNPDGTPAPVLPIPSPANVGKVPVVNAAGNGYELVEQSGGITQSTVIAREATLPTATADSPDFVEVGGVLYRKKAVEGGGLLGTWVFNDTVSADSSAEYSVSFTSGGESHTSIDVTRTTFPSLTIKIDYVNGGSIGFAYNNGWLSEDFKTIQITDISSLTNEAEFTSWLTANATKQGGGGGTVTYSYVALADA